MSQFDVIVIGGGAAGLMCAIAAGQRGRRVLVLEGSNRVGKKILMSGGGRCNFTNLQCEPARFISANPHFCISALSRYTQWDFITLVQAHGIAYHEKTLGQLFCDDSAKDILALLLAECTQANVRILTHAAIHNVRYQDGYQLDCSLGSFTADSLVIATGGLSIPRMGATDFGYRLARQFGLNVLPTRAGLVPFTFSGGLDDMMERLSGVSLPVTMGTGSVRFSEAALFTHRGLSGPAALQVSSYWSPGMDIWLDLLPGLDATRWLTDKKRSKPRLLLRSLLSDVLPRALVLELEPLLWKPHAERPLAEIPDESLRLLGQQLQGWRLRPASTEGYRTAEVTLGGIDTDELSSKTMECRRQPGLYCIGEVVDVTGHLGGFNFQWAWSSAQAAGQVA